MPSDGLSVDFDDLTFDELEELERVLKVPFDEVFEQPRLKLLRALAYLAKRRETPSFKWENAGSLKVSLATAPASKRRPTRASG